MTTRHHIARAEQYVARSPNTAIAHALIAIALSLSSRRDIGTGTPEQWAEFRASREMHGVTQTQIASQVGCSAPYLCQLETGQRSDSRGRYGLACAVLDSMTGDD